MRTWTVSPASLPIALRSFALTGDRVRAVPLGHQRAVERLAVDHTADLHEPASAEQLRFVVDHDARPRTGVLAFLKVGVELFDHDAESLWYGDSTHRRASAPSSARRSSV